jgi:hypothetical protein
MAESKGRYQFQGWKRGTVSGASSTVETDLGDGWHHNRGKANFRGSFERFLIINDSILV